MFMDTCLPVLTQLPGRQTRILYRRVPKALLGCRGWSIIHQDVCINNNKADSRETGVQLLSGHVYTCTTVQMVTQDTV